MIRPAPTPAALAALALALAAAAPAQAVGRAEVRYIEPDTFTDAGLGNLERERTQRLLSGHFERLAQRLPDGQVLRVEVTDVDLAGEVDMFSFHRIRVMGEVPDAPRLTLRFELLDGSQVLASGEDRLIDMGYLFRRSGLRESDPLPYESRMIEAWFGQRFGPPLASAGGR